MFSLYLWWILFHIENDMKAMTAREGYIRFALRHVGDIPIILHSLP